MFEIQKLYKNVERNRTFTNVINTLATVAAHDIF